MNKVDILDMYWDLIWETSASIPVDKLRVSTKLSPTDIAAVHYRGLSYAVCRLHKPNEWTDEDKIAVKQIVRRPYFGKLSRILGNATQTPTLMLVQNKDIELFVEVLTVDETITAGIVEFFIRHGDRWPTRILQIANKEVAA